MNTLEIAKNNIIYKTLTGSRAYGTALPESDTDYRSVFCNPREIREDIFLNVENVQDKSEDDSEYDELEKYVKLLAFSSPNKIETLFTPAECHEIVHPAFQRILDNKRLFLTKKARYTFGNYGVSQYGRILRHKKWIDTLENKTESERMEVKPSIVSYIRFIDNSGQELEFTKEQAFDFFSHHFATKVNHTTFKLYSLDEHFNKPMLSSLEQENISWVDISLEELHKLQPIYQGVAIVSFEAFQKDNKEYGHYVTWRRERNNVRAELEAKHSFDTKFAMHAIRLSRMCKEILLEGECRVKRPDAVELLSIRNGAWSYERIVEYFEETIKSLDTWYEQSTLPKHPDLKKISELYQEAVEIFDKSRTQI